MATKRKSNGPHIILGGEVRICVLHRPDYRRSCSSDSAWASAPEMAMHTVAKGQRATVSIQQGMWISYWDVVGVRSAKNITHKLPRARRR